LKQQADVNYFLTNFKQALLTRINIFYKTIKGLKNLGYKVDAIAPQGAIYLAIKIDVIGYLTKAKQVIKDADDIMCYLLEEANIAVVPFYLFGMEKTLPWFRLSVGTCSLDEAKSAANALSLAIIQLKTDHLHIYYCAQ
jgi:aspartate aminotransferase